MGEIELTSVLWKDVEKEMTPLFAAHAKELGDHAGINLSPVQMKALSDYLLIIVARNGRGVIIGYCIWVVTQNLQNASELIAELKPWYVIPEARNSRIGLRLFRESLARLRSIGVSRCFPHHWGNPTLGKFFEHLGARPREWVYEMEL